MTVKKANVIPLWKVYPRIHYFKKRFVDLFPRFKNLIGAFPKSFQKEKKLVEIETLATKFDMTLEVNVIGTCNLESDKYLVDTRPMLEEAFAYIGAPGVKIYICYVKCRDCDPTCRQGLDEALAYFNSFYKKFIADMFFVVEIESGTTEVQKNEIRSHVTVKLQDPDGVWDPDERLCFGVEGSLLATRISVHLERQLMAGFHLVYTYLKEFVPQRKRRSKRELDCRSIFKERSMTNNIRGFLHDVKGQVDHNLTSESEDGMEVDMSINEKQSSLALANLSRMVRCKTASILADKYNLTQWVCNLLLDETNFEEKVKGAISPLTMKYMDDQINHVRKLDDSVSGKISEVTASGYKFLLYKIDNDLSKVLSDAEKTVSSAERITGVMRKMMLEIEGYLQQTITEEFHPTTKPPYIPFKMRQDLLDLRHVHAVATVLNEFEILLHTEEEAMDDGVTSSNTSTETDALQSPMFSDVQKEIALVLERHNFKAPYKVKFVTELPRALANVQHEHGKQIHSPWPDQPNLNPRSGTLGGFMAAVDGSLYALTCAHVVNSHEQEHSVYIYDRGPRLKKFAVSTPEMTVNFGTLPSFALIDFAAIKVVDEMKPNCIRLLKDEDGINRPSGLCTLEPNQLVGRVVYKYGATTHLTSGMIVSTDLEISNSPYNYLVMVESLPGLASAKFADRGDSGSIVCMQNVTSDDVMARRDHKHLLVVSMINAGDMLLMGEENDKTLSFMVKTGLDYLQQQSNLPLSIE